MDDTLKSRPVEQTEKEEAGEAAGSGVFRTIREYVVLILVALALSFIIRATVAEVRGVPTGSMIPTIIGGLPGRTDDRLLTIKALYYFADPKRNDIVVFDPPEALRSRFNEPFVKRLVGQPGDTVEVKAGATYVNGKEFKVAAADRPTYAYGPVRVPAKGDVIEMRGGGVYVNGTQYDIPVTALQTLPPDIYGELLNSGKVKLT
ncbi:MAG: signal peptidase I, partial [Chloroflexi bacterium]|nr:signal peptidase I [Chloroflexota bacterium]